MTRRADLLPDDDRAERELLLDLLAGATPALTFGRGVDEKRFLAITPKWLYPLVYVRVRDLSGAPAALIEQLAVHYRGNVMLSMKRRAILRDVMARLDTENIPHLVLKGPVLAYGVYGDPATRTMADLDLLVRPSDLDRALAALQRDGYVIPSRYHGLALEPGDAAPLEPRGGGPLIELHSMLDSTGDDVEATEAAWSRSRRVALGDGLTVATLAPGDFFLQVAAHLSKHHRFVRSLRGLVDVALLMREDLPWREIAEEGQRLSIARWVALTAGLAHHLLNATLPAEIALDETIDEALPLAALQLWPSERDRVPHPIIVAFDGRAGTPMTPHLHRDKVIMPRGAARLRVRASRVVLLAGRLAGAVARGALRPSNVATALALFRKRERLIALMENGDT